MKYLCYELNSRPNRRVNVHASYLEFNETEKDENDEKMNELDKILIEEDETLDFLPNPNEFDEVDEMIQRQTRKRKKGLSKSTTASKSMGTKRLRPALPKQTEKQEWNSGINYKLLKDSICVGCSKELEKDKIDQTKDLFNDKTEGGSKLFDIFVTIIDNKAVSESNYGRCLCRKCFLVLEQIEFYYHEWRSLVDGFRDTFTLGQKNLDLDFGSTVDVEAHQDDDLCGIIQTMDLCKNAVVKILENDSLHSFNPKSIGAGDFDCR